MTRKNLKIIMEIRGFTLTKIASKLGISTTCLYDTISGKMSSKKIESALENRFGLPIDVIRKAWNTPGRPVMTPEIEAKLSSYPIAVNA